MSVYPSGVETATQHVSLENGDFIALAGTVIFQNRLNEKALSAIYDSFNGDPAVLDSAHGHFALAIYKYGVLSVFTDRIGAFKLFYAPSARTLSTSFLTLATALPHTDLDLQAVHEYVLSGATLGDATLLKQVTTLPSRAMAIMSDGQPIRINTFPLRLPVRSDRPRAELLVATEKHLDRFFDSVTQVFGDRILCALTGGYDTRLILAHLLRRGLKPRLLIYDEYNEDVRISKRIAAEEGMNLEVIDPDVLGPIPLDQFTELVHENYLNQDGYHFEGLFNAGLERTERRARVVNSTAYLHGGGGEIFRNFFKLPDRPLRTREVVQAMYAKYDPRVCASTFDRRGYEDAITAKIDGLLGTHLEMLDRQVVEWLYPNFRCRAWFGRDTSLNNAAGASLMPFYELEVTEFAATIPVDEKRWGTFEAELILRANPRIAAYPSQYGHDFASAVPLRRRLIENLQCATPPSLRPLLYALRERRHNVPSPYLSASYRRAVFGNEIHPVLCLFNFDHPADPLVRSRILTVAYLARSLGI